MLIPKTKRTFFEKLTGAIRIQDDTESKEIEIPDTKKELLDGEESDGQLTVDVYQTYSDIVIKTMVAGVKPEDLDISITRDMVTIKGKRETERNITEEDYFQRELYWGSFSRTILLPQEIEVDEAEAVEKHGLLILKLPKIDKNRQTKLRVKNNNN
ncbi:MAG: Hsp20/alpha crystallin family protein [Parcubacteria group bacterium]|nr:Hsp20/alpha crystallin family protein [Parcubacteria group bacterium]